MARAKAPAAHPKFPAAVLSLVGLSPVVAAAAAMGVSGLVDGQVGALQRPQVVAELLAVNVAFLLGAYLLAWAVFGLLLRRTKALDAALHSGLSSAVVVVGACAPLPFDAIKAISGGDWAGLWPLLFVAFTVSSAFAVAFILARRGGTSAPGRGHSLLASGGLLLGGALTFVALLQQGVSAALPYAAVCVATLLGAGMLFRGMAVLALPACLLLAALAAPWLTQAVVGALGPERPAFDPKRPRTVVLLTIDTLRWDVLGTYNPRSKLMPHLTELASGSQVFTQARSVSPWTRPSFASIHTGVGPMVHGVSTTEGVLPAAVPTLAEKLHDLGYVTVGAGANHNLLRAFGFARGFDEYAMGGEPLGHSYGAAILKALRRADFHTEGIAARGLRALREHDGQPLFLWLHHLAPHIPYQPPPTYYPEGTPASRIGYVFGDAPLEQPDEVNRDQPYDSVEQAWLRALYEGEVRYVDALVGEFLQELKRLGRYDDAVIAFASDHGEEFWDHAGFEHGHTMYDELLRVPLFVRIGSQGGAGRVDTPVSTHALFPTLLELVGERPDFERLDSASLLPLVADAAARSRRAPAQVATSTLYGEPQEAIVEGGDKLIVRLESGRRELYRLTDDPLEQRDLAAIEPTRVQTLEALLMIEHDSAEQLRARLGIRENGRITLEAETVEQLRRLGYVR